MRISILKLKVIFLIAVLFFGFTKYVDAQELGNSSPDATESSKVTYTLSYPGLLPDHPLYFLKAARDKIVAFFISDPLKKADYDVLQADKRIESSLLLVQKSKFDLARDTFSKGENYFEDGIDRMSDAKTQGMDIQEMAKHLLDANTKHQDVFRDMTNKFSKEEANKWKNEKIRLKQLEEKVKKLNKK